jgi:hypothetical protein
MEEALGRVVATGRPDLKESKERKDEDGVDYGAAMLPDGLGDAIFEHA